VLREAKGDAASDPAWLNHLGTVLASSGRLEEAEKALRRAIELRPAEASPYLNLARVQLARGDRAGALETLGRARDGAPGDPRVAARIKELGGSMQ
jgi:Flp pilus assembly protein TadD